MPVSPDKYLKELAPDDFPGDLREIAKATSVEFARYLVKHWGGVSIYIPALSTVEKAWRDERILDEWNGMNDGELAAKYAVNRRYVQELVRKESRRRRGQSERDLFSSDA